MPSTCRDVKCPFYRKDDWRSKLTCDGIVDDSTITLTFKNKADLNQQIDIFCCDFYKNCEIYRMIMEARY